nr:MAG: nonstructural protein [Microvirus sp.]
MKLNVYCIYDNAVKEYTQPFLMHADGEALRGFAEVVNDKTSKINKYPDDYSLHALCEWDSSNGTYTPEIPRLLKTARELLQ